MTFDREPQFGNLAFHRTRRLERLENARALRHTPCDRLQFSGSARPSMYQYDAMRRGAPGSERIHPFMGT
jgi:hypothetical protein